MDGMLMFTKHLNPSYEGVTVLKYSGTHVKYKEEVISWTWECLTVDYKLNPDRLYATYFGGDAAQGLEVDVEDDARDIWLRFLPANRVIACGCKENFWELICSSSGECRLTVGFLEKDAVVTAEDGLVGVILNETSFYYESV